MEEQLTVLRALEEAIARREPAVLATVVEVRGASPAQPGFKLLVRADGSHIGNVGGGALEQEVLRQAGEVLRQGQARLVHYSLREEGPDALGMLCGGDVTVFLEPFLPKPILLIVGGGHIGRPLAEMARIVGYEVQVVDVRPERGDRKQLDPAAITTQTYVVLITENHETDEARVRAPIGLDLGGRQPAEIALAILAEIECVRHGGSGRPRSELPQAGAQ